jgi:GNAT superfamily N-acetyltransferase
MERQPLRTPVEVRLLDASDSIEELTDLLHRAYAPLAVMGFRYVATHQDAARTRQRVGGGRECYVAVQDGRIVGTVTFRNASLTRGCPWYDRPDVCSFGQFAVEPPLQRRGIGSRLMDVCERRAVETGAAELALDTAEGADHLIDLYRRRGFRFVEHTRWPEVNYRSVIMSKRVGNSADG